MLIRVHPKKSESGGSIVPALCLIAATAACLLALTIKMPGSGEPVAIVFSPSVSANEAFLRVAALDGKILREGGWDNVIVAAFSRGTSFQSLRQKGVLLTLDPVLTGGCSGTTDRNKKGLEV